MNYKILLIFLLCTLIIGCGQNLKELNKSQFKIEKKYKNIGFALIYENDIKKIKKIDDRSLLIHHKFLKRNSTVKITNPKNGRSLLAKVLSSRQKFSDFYNSIISKEF